jgi:hypothetical protein
VGRIIGDIYKAILGPALDIELYLLLIEQQIWKISAEIVSRVLSSDKILVLVSFQFLRTTKSRWRKELYLSPLEYIYKCLR